MPVASPDRFRHVKRVLQGRESNLRTPSSESLSWAHRAIPCGAWRLPAAARVGHALACCPVVEEYLQWPCVQHAPNMTVITAYPIQDRSAFFVVRFCFIIVQPFQTPSSPLPAHVRLCGHSSLSTLRTWLHPPCGTSLPPGRHHAVSYAMKLAEFHPQLEVPGDATVPGIPAGRLHGHGQRPARRAKVEWQVEAHDPPTSVGGNSPKNAFQLWPAGILRRSNGGAGGIRTLVQTTATRAFYMLIPPLVFDCGPEKGTLPAA